MFKKLMIVVEFFGRDEYKFEERKITNFRAK